MVFGWSPCNPVQFSHGLQICQPGAQTGDEADSLYMPIEQSVQKRANASQDNPTPADSFCRDLVNKLESGRSLNIIRLANGSLAFPLLKTLLPTAILEKVLGRLFGLNRLK